jgi:PAS domain S-box-containing protein
MNEKEMFLSKVKKLQKQIVELELNSHRNDEQDNKLKGIKDQYSKLCEYSAWGIVMTTPEGNILDANSTFQEMTGYSLPELKNVTTRKLSPLKWHKAEDNIVDLACKQNYVQLDKECIRKDGSIFPVTSTEWVIKDSHGKAIRRASFVKDITEYNRQ